MRPSDPARKDAPLLPPVAEAATWPGFVAHRPPEVLRRQGRLPRPVSPTLLAALVAGLDVAAVVLAGMVLQYFPLERGYPQPPLLAFFAALTVSLAGFAGGYSHAALFGGRRPIVAALGGLVSGGIGLATAALVLGAPITFRPGAALLWMGMAAPLLLAGRLGSAAAMQALPQYTRQRAVLVGSGPQAARFAATLTGRHDQGLALLGLVDNDPAAATSSGGLAYLGPVATLDGMIRRGEVDQVVLCMPWAEERRVRDLQRKLSDYPVDVTLAPDLMAYRHDGAEAPRLLRLADRPIRGWAAVVKAAEDYSLALVALALAAVPMALIALAVKLDSPGPVLFRQRRTGFNNRDFSVFKFRTMYHHAADHTVQRQVVAGDPRVTRVGAILRRTSLDELPQIFNVLKGEMSFIGPRPHAPGTRAGGRPFEEVMARYAARHRVKPGLTGLAQVRGWRGPTETEDKLIRRVESDLEYIETWSPWLDLVILVRTLLAVARMRNAC
ncbi:exopolysaccharide biosynthesis polyprenyl glycosylphosphotransferase [Paracraurococcus lichenis]|uniref:Exopolysaccharide biosynthesis polyprenyl glycosylphosphotransferase n=1 Tax=Paracraurococcus lichenis TaxID=3064888 RepID=A0ABT9DWG9_9PROT|nr:exopolysaccharide biosynthesis polyprenyl glycosylphosphotransferase [Paracraurococcus sp. LOR1-02]MDO9708244.1 exopolysaccharide biosynthesis polyprenyl glycosylphosphotransferase [Paracraurococcus sp. LOR1-02]